MQINAFVYQDGTLTHRVYRRPVGRVRIEVQKAFQLGRHINTTIIDGTVVWNFKKGSVSLSGDVVVKHGYRTAI